VYIPRKRLWIDSNGTMFYWNFTKPCHQSILPCFTVVAQKDSEIGLKHSINLRHKPFHSLKQKLSNLMISFWGRSLLQTRTTKLAFRFKSSTFSWWKWSSALELDRCHICNYVAQLYCATKSQVWHCVSRTATSSHKQVLTNQRSQHSRDKVAQNKALLYSEKELRDC